MELLFKIFSFLLQVAPWVLVIIMCLMTIFMAVMCFHHPTFEYVETSYPFGKPKLN